MAPEFTAGQYVSQTAPPPYVRIGIRRSPGSDENFTRVDHVDFDFYVKHVLPIEWGPITEPEALKAGAMAIKNYGWYYVNAGGKFNTADCDNSINCQRYEPNLTYSLRTITDPQVDAVAANGWRQGGKIFPSFYVAGDQEDPRGCLDGKGATRTDCMTQYGSQYFAQRGLNYKQILEHYYSAAPIEFFTMPPRHPTTYVSEVTVTSITLTFESPGAVNYALLKFLNGAWQLLYNGPNTSFTDVNVARGQGYYYTVAAQNDGGWSAWSFNGGFLIGIAATSTTPIAPNISTTFINDNEIHLTISSSDQNVTDFVTYRWDGMKWLSISGKRSITGDAPMSFVDPNLSPNTTYYYSASVYDPASGWSALSNNGGYIAVNTHPSTVPGSGLFSSR